MEYKILIADDEAEIRSLLRLYLENEQYQVYHNPKTAQKLRIEKQAIKKYPADINTGTRPE